MSWADYATAVVRVRMSSGEYEVRADMAIGACSGPYPPEATGPIHILSAHNPGGVITPPAANGEAHERLLADIAELDLFRWEAVGGDPAWVHTEQSVAVVGLSDDQARELGSRFGQQAVFAWRPDAWLLLGCETSRASMSGWSCVFTSTNPAEAPEEHVADPPPPPSADERELDSPPSSSTAPTPERSRTHVVRVSHRGDPLDDVEGEVLASLDWELEDGGGSPGNADYGSVYLIRDGTRYSIAQVHGGETIVDPLDAVDDDSAVVRFIANAAPDETVTIFAT